MSKISGAALLYVGKVTNVTHDVKPGWTVGTCTLAPADDGTSSNAEDRPMELQFRVSLHDSGLETFLKIARTSGSMLRCEILIIRLMYLLRYRI